MLKRTRIVALLFAVIAAAAQSVLAQTATDTTKQGTDSAAAQPKKGGMFGKLKALAHNKTAQNIVKTAACAAIPGGSIVVSAINAKQAKGVAGVAATAAGAAGAGIASGAGCFPGMAGGIPGMGGGLAGLGKGGVMAGLTGAAMSGVAGASRGATMSALAGGTTLPQGAQTANGDVAIETEAPGQQMQIPSDPAADLAKGKLVIKKIDWIKNSGALSASTTQMFSDVMTSVGGAINQTGARYRVDMYMDKHYSDEEVTSVGGQRIAMVIAMLSDRAQVGGSMQGGSAKKDKDPRIEFVQVK